MPEAMTDVRQISQIAYGFMGSKALFGALDLNAATASPSQRVTWWRYYSAVGSLTSSQMS
jgi:hypothetical protein